MIFKLRSILVISIIASLLIACEEGPTMTKMPVEGEKTLEKIFVEYPDSYTRWKALQLEIDLLAEKEETQKKQEAIQNQYLCEKEKLSVLSARVLKSGNNIFTRSIAINIAIRANTTDSLKNCRMS